MEGPGGTIVHVATRDGVYTVDPSSGEVYEGRGMRRAAPTCLIARAGGGGPVWCGTKTGVWRSDDGGSVWEPSGLEGLHVMSLAASPARDGLVWAGTEPSAVFASEDDGRNWTDRRGLDDLPSSSQWAFPPRPETHHVRWIACHPDNPGRLWVAVEAGALVTTTDGGRSWRDRVEGSPRDTHEIAIHPERPEHLRVAAGDGYFESADGGATWSSPMEGLEVGYLRSVAVDPEDPGIVVVSAASGPRSAYPAGTGDGRVYRRAGGGRWERITHGWPDEPDTIAPLLIADPGGGLLATDERGVHRSDDGGRRWTRVAVYPEPAGWLRGLAAGGLAGRR